MERRERKREEEREVFLDMSHTRFSTRDYIYMFNSGFHEWILNVTQMATLNDRLLSISSTLSKNKKML